MIAVDASGQNSIAVASGANFTLTKEQIQRLGKSIEEVDILIMPLETPPETILEAARLAKERKAQRWSFNPAPARTLDRRIACLDRCLGSK